MSVVDTRQRLLEIALELIWQSNYSSVGVNEICSQAGVTKGAFYHHFESKASLFYEASSYYWEVIKKDFDNMFSPINSPLEQLENLIYYLFVAKNEDQIPGCPFYNVGAQIGSNDDKVIAALQAMSTNALKYNTALVKALQAGNYLERQDDPEQIARILYQYIHGVMSHVRINDNLEQAKNDLPSGLYRLLSLKPELWFSTQPTWQPSAK
ncbi:MAG: TetR/AcrR family transcriptional regulator [Gammaproteobacteria bacterium]|nr:TetR/AcrR family transcriptional regulator [Gammaproteobacteria bacterium]